MKERLCLLFNTYLWTVAVFAFAKVGFMLSCLHDHSFSAGDVMDVILHGLTLDLSTALYFLIVPFLMVFVSIWWRSKVFDRILRSYFLLISVAFAIAFVADASLYPFWGFKLEGSCLQYLNSPDEMMASVSYSYILVRLALIILLSVSFTWVYWHIPMNLTAIRRRIASSIVFLLTVPVLIIGIRGGIRDSTTNIGQVYYSQDQFLNLSAVNPVFSFLYSLSHTLGNMEQYQLMDESECSRWTANIYTTESIDYDTLLTTTRPDVVVILMESTGEQFAKVMPYLQQLKQEGIYFANCYGNSWRTDRGTVCALSGYPSFPTISVMKIPQKSNSLPSIARCLQQEGYATTYLYGGDINFTNMRSYLVATGWEHIISMENFPVSDRVSANWGVRDDITFRKLADLLENKKSQESSSGEIKKRLFGFSTLSSHEPWDVPEKTMDDKVLNAFAYLDHCLRDFIEPLKQTPLWDDLLIILIADHGIKSDGVDLANPLQKNHIPMLWVGGAVKKPHRIDKLCNQTDLAATLLGQLGLKHDDYPFSRDVLSSTYTYPTAVHNYNNAQLLIDSTGYILYDFDARRLTISRSPDSLRLTNVSKAILQQTTKDLKER